MVRAYGPSFPSLPFIVIANISLCIAVPITYCMGGKIKHKQDFSHWQPFVGGRKFVWLQALAWTAYSFSLLLGLICVYFSMKRVPLMGVLLPSTGVVGIVSHLLVFLSLEYFEGHVLSGRRGGNKKTSFRFIFFCCFLISFIII